MSTMECSRSNCDNCLCDNYVSGIGYICGSCRYEFQEYIENKFPDQQLTEATIESELKTFMETKKGVSSTETMSVSDYFNKNS